MQFRDFPGRVVALRSSTAAAASLLIPVCAGLGGCTRVRLIDAGTSGRVVDALHCSP